MSLIFKEYTVKFQDGEQYYAVSVCRAFPKNHSHVAKYVGKSDNPYKNPMQVIPGSSVTSSNLKDLVKYWQRTAWFGISKLKWYLVKKRCKKCCQSRDRCVGQGIGNHIH